MTKPVLLPSGRWRVLIRRKGFQRVDEIFEAEAEAAEFARKKLAEMHIRRADAYKDGRSTELTLADAWAGYQKGVKFNGKRPSTQTRERKCAAHLLRLLGKTELRLIDEPVIQEYIEQRVSEDSYRKTKTSGDSIRLEKSLLSQIFDWARLRKHVSRNPARGGGYEMPACNTREIRIDLDQQGALVGAAIEFVQNKLQRTNPCAQPWLSFTLGTGMRPGEAAKIEMSWVKIKDKVVNIPARGAKNKTPRTLLIPANVVPLFTKAMEAAIAADSPYVFFSKSAKNGIVPYRYSKPWKSICARAGLPADLVPHGMRHEFISNLVETSNLSDSVIADFVGDKHAVSLTPYKHLRSTKLRPKHDEIVAQRTAVHKAWAHEKFLDHLAAEQAKAKK